MHSLGVPRATLCAGRRRREDRPSRGSARCSAARDASTARSKPGQCHGARARGTSRRAARVSRFASHRSRPARPLLAYGAYAAERKEPGSTSRMHSQLSYFALLSSAPVTARSTCETSARVRMRARLVSLLMSFHLSRFCLSLPSAAAAAAAAAVSTTLPRPPVNEMAREAGMEEMRAPENGTCFSDHVPPPDLISPSCVRLRFLFPLSVLFVSELFARELADFCEIP